MDIFAHNACDGSPELLQELQRVRPGVLTAFVADEGAIKKISGIVSEVAFSLGIRVGYKILTTGCRGLQETIAVRRVSALDPGRPRYSIVRLGDVRNPQEVGRYLRGRLFNVIDDSDKQVEFFLPEPVPEPPSISLPDAMCGSVSCEDAEPVRPEAPRVARLRKMALKEVKSLPRADEVPQERSLEEEKRRWVDALSALMVQYMLEFHEAPPMEMIAESVRGKILLNGSRKSPVTVSGDMKIYLPELNEIQLRMTPLATTVYILFLCHPEGIRLKDIADYRHELAEIYSMVKPGGSEAAAEASIADLVNPLGNSLQEKLSMTRKAVRRYILDRAMAEHYLIKGERGGLYRIELDPELIRLPLTLRKE